MFSENTSVSKPHRNDWRMFLSITVYWPTAWFAHLHFGTDKDYPTKIIPFLVKGELRHQFSLTWAFCFTLRPDFTAFFFFSFPEPPTHALDVIQSFFHVQKLQRWRLTEHAHINIISSESQGKRTHVNRLPAITAQMHWMESPLVWFLTTGTKTNQHCLLNWFSSLLL